jgi:DNA-binding winged helix-turn-helix (wHTH) protein/TolB-like protein/Tfp pilus assembly protein PilF
MSLQTNNIYEFEQFRLDFSEKTLRNGGGLIPIAPKVFDMLCVLVENAGHLIEKDELMQKLWQDRFVEESNLTFSIKMLRKALGDDASKPTYIETVPKRGYRFIAEVRLLEVAKVEGANGSRGGAERKTSLSANSSATSLPVSPPPRLRVSSSQKGAVVALADWRRQADGNEAVEQVSPLITPDESTENNTGLELIPPKVGSHSKHLPKHRLPLAALAAILIGAIAFGHYFFYSGKTTSRVSGKKSIAVLPLVPINSANRDEIYEVGIADSLIQKLRSMKGFVVRPLSAIRKYAGVEQDALAAGREQRVGFVMTSTYQLADGKIRVTVQIVNVANGEVEETYTCEKDAANVFTMQDAIANDIGNKLLTLFATTASSPAGKLGTTSEEAYRLYLQGMYLYDKRTPPDAQKAVELLEQAIQIDPNYAQAWAAKAHVHRSLGNFSSDTHEEYRKSIEAINRAFELDENLTDAHSALCENKFFYERDFVGAALECQRAIELDPNSSLAHQIYSRNLMVIGQFDESIAEIKTAIDLEPTSLFSQRNFGIAFYYARRYVEAVSQFKRVTEMDPNFEATYPWLVNSLKLLGNDAEAFDWFMKWQAVRGTDDETARIFRMAFQKSGWQGVERERVKKFDESKLRTYFMEACMAAQAGNHDKALEYLESSYRRREWGMAYLRIEPSLDVLRGEPRFDDILRRVDENLP